VAAALSRAQCPSRTDRRNRNRHPGQKRSAVAAEDSFHRIRHYGLFANTSRADNIARARELLAVPKPRNDAASAGSTDASEPPTHSHPCPCCGGRISSALEDEPNAMPPVATCEGLRKEQAEQEVVLKA
jgi:hypothetical protein